MLRCNIVNLSAFRPIRRITTDKHIKGTSCRAATAPDDLQAQCALSNKLKYCVSLKQGT